MLMKCFKMVYVWFLIESPRYIYDGSFFPGKDHMNKIILYIVLLNIVHVCIVLYFYCTRFCSEINVFLCN